MHFTTRLAVRRHYSKALDIVKIQKTLHPFLSIAEPVDGTEAANKLVAIKDNLCIARQDMPTTCASRILRDYRAPYTAVCLQSLLAPGSGFRLAGKTNLDEFAMGSYTLHSAYGPTFHPSWLQQAAQEQSPQVAGGSSGGSAVSVALDLADVAIGTDTGGSVRLPAAYNNIIGFKPSLGRISRDGLVSFAHSLDTVGLFVKQDLRLLRRVFDLMCQQSGNDMTHWRRSEPAQELGSRRALKIGVVSELIVEEIPTASLTAFQSLLNHLTDCGHALALVSLPSIKLALPAYYAFVSIECASNLARFDGLRYGHSKLDGQNGFGAEVTKRVLLGTFLSLSDGSWYEKACQFRAQLKNEFHEHFQHCDLLISLTAATPAPRLADIESDSNPLVECSSDLMTIPANIAGVPALSMPMSPDAPAHEALGVHLIGPWGKDEEVLQMCAWIQADIQQRPNSTVAQT